MKAWVCSAAAPETLRHLPDTEQGQRGGGGASTAAAAPPPANHSALMSSAAQHEGAGQRRSRQTETSCSLSTDQWINV